MMMMMMVTTRMMKIIEIKAKGKGKTKIDIMMSVEDIDNGLFEATENNIIVLRGGQTFVGYVKDEEEEEE